MESGGNALVVQCAADFAAKSWCSEFNFLEAT